MTWTAGNASLKAAHEKYGPEFEKAYAHFRDLSDGDVAGRAALWADVEDRGENLMAWFRARKC